MNLEWIIAQIASDADEFLAGAGDRGQARAGIAQLLTVDYFELTPADRAVVTAGVMAALEADEFFGIEFVGDPFKDEPETEPDE